MWHVRLSSLGYAYSTNQFYSNLSLWKSFTYCLSLSESNAVPAWTAQSNQMSLSALPLEVLNLIVAQLDYVDFVRLRSTNRYFDTLAPASTTKTFVRNLDFAMYNILYQSTNPAVHDIKVLDLAFRFLRSQLQACRTCARILPWSRFFSVSPRDPTFIPGGICTVCLLDDLSGHRDSVYRFVFP